MNPSASALDRVQRCPASHVLPRVEETSEAAERGTEIHEFLRRWLSDPDHRERYLDLVPIEWRETCARLDIHSLLADDPEC